MMRRLFGIIFVLSLFSLATSIYGQCPNPGIFADSTSGSGDFILVCPAGDETYIVFTKDSCGNPVCDPANVWFDFSTCSSTPCVGKHPDWPKVYPDSCDPATGKNYFTIYAANTSCGIACTAGGVLNGIKAVDLPVRFFDTDGDHTVSPSDFNGGQPCADYNYNFSSEVVDSIIHANHWGHDCSGVPTTLCCDYIKPSFIDYAPSGVPDFDQKQNQPAWSDGINPTHCGPVAMANGLWWFDSKLDGINVAPPVNSDGYSLISQQGGWDDHDPQNVVPTVDLIAWFMKTNNVVKGTTINDFQFGTRGFIGNAGISIEFVDSLQQYPSFDFIKQQITSGNMVTMLLGFYETVEDCCRLGGHYVTAAGVCNSSRNICVSDPWYDKAEGEPPAGAIHPPTIHNDAMNISGPHGQNNHDDYTLTPNIRATCLPPEAETINYPFGIAEANNFFEQNRDESGDGCGSVSNRNIVAVIEYAYVLSHQTSTDIGDAESGDLPNKFELSQNYPNPFNPTTQIEYSLPQRRHVKITIYNMLGKLVTTLTDKEIEAGFHSVSWDGNNNDGQAVGSGVYLYKIEAGEFVSSKKMMLLK